MGPCLNISLEEGRQCWAFFAAEGGDLGAVLSTAQALGASQVLRTVARQTQEGWESLPCSGHSLIISDENWRALEMGP